MFLIYLLRHGNDALKVTLNLCNPWHLCMGPCINCFKRTLAGEHIALQYIRVIARESEHCAVDILWRNH